MVFRVERGFTVAELRAFALMSEQYEHVGAGTRFQLRAKTFLRKMLRCGWLHVKRPHAAPVLLNGLLMLENTVGGS